ncbi:hypothetical protein [Mycobacterium florentinum]|uniref:hypothetical protein n=1 Tax=Mycobacterium florentinum TaxID=292462 RepID=UPI001E3506BE|nr:hypothetical protein [Mycobacterium florentinum]
MALANQSVKETFEQCSIVWQAIPNWDTGDPGQIRVADGKYNTPGFLNLGVEEEEFEVTLAQANGPTPDSLLTEVMAASKTLAKKVDDDILPKLYAGAATTYPTKAGAQELQDTLIKARADVEDAGCRAPSCLLTNTTGLAKLSQLVSGASILPVLVTAANFNALHRSTQLDPPDSGPRMVLIGRRRRIPQGAAPEASPGEEPVDVAVSLAPSLEIDGETGTGAIKLTVRIRYALRITDATGLVAIHNP